MSVELFIQTVAFCVIVFFLLGDYRRSLQLANVAHARVLGAKTAGRCPFCHKAFEEDSKPEEQDECNGCDTLHHHECWLEHGGCSVYGCQSTSSIRILGLGSAVTEKVSTG